MLSAECDPGGALQAAQAHAAFLKKELGLDSTAELRDLIAALQAPRPPAIGDSGGRPQHQALSTEHPALSTKHSAPSTKHQAPSTQHQALSTEHPAPSTLHEALST